MGQFHKADFVPFHYSVLPPPDEPIGNGMATAAKSGSKDQDFHTISEAENPVYTGDISGE